MHADLLDNLEDQTIAEWVPISQMFVDPAYTRPVSEAQINRMLRNGFDADKLGVIMLSMREDGRYAVLDGNHRREAAKKVGIKQMRALVFIDKTPKQEADLFVAFNTMNRPTALDRFRARLSMGELQATEIQKILNKHGMTVAISGAVVGGVSAVAALDKLYSEAGPRGTYEVVNILHRAWGQERRAWVTQMIEGMRQFWLRYHAEVDKNRLVDRMQLTTPERVLAQSGAVVRKSTTVGTLIGQTVADQYNAGLRSHRLSEWIDHPGKKFATASTPSVET